MAIIHSNINHVDLQSTYISHLTAFSSDGNSAGSVWAKIESAKYKADAEKTKAQYQAEASEHASTMDCIKGCVQSFGSVAQGVAGLMTAYATVKKTNAETAAIKEQSGDTSPVSNDPTTCTKSAMDALDKAIGNAKDTKGLNDAIGKAQAQSTQNQSTIREYGSNIGKMTTNKKDIDEKQIPDATTAYGTAQDSTKGAQKSLNDAEKAFNKMKKEDPNYETAKHDVETKKSEFKKAQDDEAAAKTKLETLQDASKSLETSISDTTKQKAELETAQSQLDAKLTAARLTAGSAATAAPTTSDAKGAVTQAQAVTTAKVKIGDSEVSITKNGDKWTDASGAEYDVTTDASGNVTGAKKHEAAAEKKEEVKTPGPTTKTVTIGDKSVSLTQQDDKSWKDSEGNIYDSSSVNGAEATFVKRNAPTQTKITPESLTSMAAGNTVIAPDGNRYAKLEGNSGTQYMRNGNKDDIVTLSADASGNVAATPVAKPAQAESKTTTRQTGSKFSVATPHTRCKSTFKDSEGTSYTRIGTSFNYKGTDSKIYIYQKSTGSMVVQ